MRKRVSLIIAAAVLVLCGGLFALGYHTAYQAVLEPSHVRWYNRFGSSSMGLYGQWFSLSSEYIRIPGKLPDGQYVSDVWLFDFNEDEVFELAVQYFNELVEDDRIVDETLYQFATAHGYSADTPFRYADVLEKPVVMWKILYETDFLETVNFQYLRDPRQDAWRREKYGRDGGYGTIKLNWRGMVDADE